MPVQFPPEAPAAIDIGAARFTSAAVLADGSVWTWGFDDSLGVLGRGGEGPGRSLLPEPVPGLTRAIAVEGSAYGYFLAVRNTCGGSGAVVTWGELLGGLDADGVGGKPMGPHNVRPVALQSFGDTAACDEYEVTVYPLGTGGGRIVSDSGVLDCGEHCTQYGAPDELVTLTAIPDEGSEFAGWDWDCAGGAATATVQLTRNMDCLAYFRGPASGEVSVSVLPASGAGRIVSDPAGLDCGSECSRIFGAGTSVTLQPAAPTDPVAAALYAFERWTGDADCEDGAVEVDGDTACIARFQRVADRYELAVEIRGDGRVTSMGEVNGEVLAVDCAGSGNGCGGVYEAGTRVRLDLQPAPGFEVVNAFGVCDIPGATPVAEATVTADGVCTVVFDRVDAAAEAVAVIIAEDTMPAANQTIVLDGSASYVLDPATGAQFTDLIDLWEWHFEDDGLIDVSGPAGSADRVSHAWPSRGIYDVFLRVTGRSSQDGGSLVAATRLTISVGGETPPPGAGPFTLTVGPAGTFRGAVSVNPPGPAGLNVAPPPFETCAEITCSQRYDAGTSVDLTAVPDSRDEFVEWQGADCPIAGSTQPAGRVVMNDDVACFPVFRELAAATVTLTVDVDAGLSYVRTTDGRIDCPGVCSADYPAGTEDTLVAENGPGEALGGWTGDCAAFGQSTGFRLVLMSDTFCGAFFQ